MNEDVLIKKLDAEFDKLLSLNPDRDDLDFKGSLATAREIGPGGFDHFRRRTEELVSAYVGSPWKITEAAVVGKYLQKLNIAAKQLTDDGRLQLRESKAANQQNASTVSLVPLEVYTSTDWIRILESAGISRPLARAVDAASERNRLINTVLPTAFRVLHALDDKAAYRWELVFLEQNSGRLDSDLVRELIQTWREQEALPPAVLDWVFQWSLDEKLERQWPGVVAVGDRLLRERAMQAWFAKCKPKRASVVHLKKLLMEPGHGEKSLSRWLDSAVASVGEELNACMSLRNSLMRADSDSRASMLRASMVRSLKSLRRQFVPVLVMGDLLLNKPAGVYWLALAALGISHTGLSRWRRKLEKQAYNVVQKVFLENMRNGVTPEITIQKLTFGDSVMAQTLLNRLDLLSREFESLEDRDAVAEELAVNYASFREGGLLEKSLTGRYRQVMILLHEDTLRQLFSTSTELPVDELIDSLRDVYSLASEARQYLNCRLSLRADAREIIGSEMDFSRLLRQRRFRLIYSLLQP